MFRSAKAILARFSRRQDGGASIEFIMMWPIFIVLLGYIGGLGTFAIYHHTLEVSIENGLQYLSNVPLDILDAPGDGSCDPTILQNAENIMFFGDLSGTVPVVNWPTDLAVIECQIISVDETTPGGLTIQMEMIELAGRLTIQLPGLDLIDSAVGTSFGAFEFEVSRTLRHLEG